MSIHVCKCEHNGKTEYHLRYPGVNQDEAQGLADQINGGAILALRQDQAGDQWREAVEERFAVNHLDMPEDPREAIKKLIATEVRDALDPSISSAAAALAQAGVPDDIVKDAKRYRWLRASTFPKADQYPYRISTKPIRLPIGFDDQSTFDAAIDAAMLTAPTGQKGNI